MAKKQPGLSLTLRIPHIREEGEPYCVELDEAELAELLSEAGDYRTAGQGLKADLQLARYDENVSVRGQLETLVAYTCSRCLADATERLRVELRWRFLPAGPYRAAASPEEELELTADDMDVSFYDGDQIDLREVIREALLLELEPYPVCRDGCPEDAVAVPDSEEDELDPRWLPLLEIKRRQRS